MSAVTAVAVLRDESTGDCFLVNTGTTDRLDIERLEESSLELAGWLYDPEQLGPGSDDADYDACEDDEDERPCFTTCEHDGCGRLIMIIGGGAPEFCTEHTEAES